MKEKLFNNAFECILGASDYVNFRDGEYSFLYDGMLRIGFNKEEAEEAMMNLGQAMYDRAMVYAECFEALGVDSEYVNWSLQPGRIEKATEQLLERLKLVEGLIAQPDLVS